MHNLITSLDQMFVHPEHGGPIWPIREEGHRQSYTGQILIQQSFDPDLPIPPSKSTHTPS